MSPLEWLKNRGWGQSCLGWRYWREGYMDWEIAAKKTKCMGIKYSWLSAQWRSSNRFQFSWLLSEAQNDGPKPQRNKPQVCLSFPDLVLSHIITTFEKNRKESWTLHVGLSLIKPSTNMDTLLSLFIQTGCHGDSLHRHIHWLSTVSLDFPWHRS